MRKGFSKSLIVIGIVLLVWSIITMATDWVSPLFLPSPLDIARAYWDMKGNLGLAIFMSLMITLSGFGIGLIVGMGMGLLMAYSRGFLDSVGPLMEFTRPVPVFALIPLFMLWFGIGFWPQILLVALGVSAILGVETYEAIRNLPLVYIRAASNLGADKKTIFRTVVIPYIFPHLIGAIRVAAAASWGLDVAAEFMGVQVGLGYNMIVQQIYLNTAGIIAIVFIYSGLAITLDQAIRRLETRITFWTERSKVSFEKVC
ncbi:MAG: ABC transporter permease [Atribacterota bacterium]|jgi:ABC-type nitrate/sulfonate/bicarbonate transport system permease component|nr:ABC transporter permease [Atribacterota bacterium]